jgi:MFS family permease
MSPSDAPINWKRNLTVAWLFFTGAAFSLVMPFLPLYVEQLGVTGHSALNMWSGLVFSITFLFSAMASPFWGGLADRKGRKIMLLRSALGMAIIMALMGVAQNVWQFLIARAAGPAGGIYSQRECPDCHANSLAIKRLGAGHALNRRRERCPAGATGRRTPGR